MSMLSNRWAQIMNIKKQIHHKNKELKKYKLLAQKRLNALRHIRKMLAETINKLIAENMNKLKLSSRSQTKSQLARLWYMYQRSLIKWKKRNKLQQRRIKQLHATDNLLNNRLRILRNRLKMNPRHKWIIAKSLRIFRKPMNLRYILNDAGLEDSPELLKSLLLELSCIERYLKDRGQKKIHKASDTLDDISIFLKSAKRVKKRKHQKKQKKITEHVQLTDVQEEKVNLSPIQTNTRSTLDHENADKKLLEIETQMQNIIESKEQTVKTNNTTKQMMEILSKPHALDMFLEKKPERNILTPYQLQKRVFYERPSYLKPNQNTIKEELGQIVESVTSVKLPLASSSKKRKKLKKVIPIEPIDQKDNEEDVVEETDSQMLLRTQRMRLKAYKTLLRNSENNDSDDGDMKSKRNDDSWSNISLQSPRSSKSKRKEDSILNAIEQRYEEHFKEHSKPSKINGKKQLSASMTNLQQLKHLQKVRGLSHYEARQLRELEEKYQKRQLQKLNDQAPHLQKQQNKLQQRRKQLEQKLADEFNKELIEPAAPQDSQSSVERTVSRDVIGNKKFDQQLEKGKSALKLIFEGIKHKEQPSDLLLNKTKPDADESTKISTVGNELMDKLAMEHKHKETLEVQNLLKDTIRAPSIMDAMVDRNSFITMVQSHEMWNTLSELNKNLKSVHIPKPSIYEMLRSQYLRFIQEIVSEAIKNGAKVIKRKLKAHKFEMNEPKSSDSLDDLERIRMPNDRKSGLSYSSMDILDRKFSAESSMYRELTRMDERYSVRVIQSILSAHCKYFQHKECMEQAERASVQKIKKQSKDTKKAQMARITQRKPEKRSTSACVKRLFYEPRRTWRQRQADEECNPCECPSEAKLDVCIKCGAELMPLPNSETSSRTDLGLPEDVLNACIHNREVLEATANICERCSFVHKPNVLCPSFNNVGIGNTKLQQQLHLIKHYANSQQQQQAERCSSCCSCCCQPAARKTKLNA